MENVSLPPEITPRIVFEDTHLVVLNKPAGLLSQGEATGDVNLVDYLRGYFGRNYVGLVHRLDRNTSGLMVVAKRSKSADRLTQSLQNGKLVRKYQAWVEGEVKTSARWEHYLLKDEKSNLVRVHPSGKKSALKATPLETSTLGGTLITLLEFELETGRSHQIRVQASAEGYPLVGDIKYGKTLSSDSKKFPRPALHSHWISFPHPMTEDVLTFSEPLPKDMLSLRRR
jgi:23S rRNA pseudouridine1911/1915/1917 synthase